MLIFLKGLSKEISIVSVSETLYGIVEEPVTLLAISNHDNSINENESDTASAIKLDLRFYSPFLLLQCVTSQHILSHLEQVIEIGVCLIKLAGSELWVMVGVNAFVAELLSQLVHSLSATNDQLLCFGMTIE
jgi:hypothetical protein